MRTLLTSLMLALCLMACAQAPKSIFPEGLSPIRVPTENRQAFGLAHIDVETTGLDPRFHEIIDIGAIYTDLDGRELGRIYLRILPDHPERLSSGAKAINGFDLAYWRANGAMSEQEAVERLLAFHAKAAGGREMLFTAWNVPFDHAFVDSLLRQHGHSWRTLFHYQPLDLPSMAWALGHEGLRGRVVGPEFGIDPETEDPRQHIGMTGAEFNVAFYRALLSRRPAPPPSQR